MTATTLRAPARELTDWFPAEVKPVHVGVYWTVLIDAYEQFGYSYWDGNHWGNQHSTPAVAEAKGGYPGWQDKPWRGLKEPA